MNEYGALVEWYWQGKVKYWEKSPFQCHFVDHNSTCTVLEQNPALRADRPATNHLCLSGTVLKDHEPEHFRPLSYDVDEERSNCSTYLLLVSVVGGYSFRLTSSGTRRFGVECDTASHSRRPKYSLKRLVFPLFPLHRFDTGDHTGGSR